jgi:hypothetical protein
MFRIIASECPGSTTVSSSNSNIEPHPAALAELLAGVGIDLSLP